MSHPTDGRTPRSECLTPAVPGSSTPPSAATPLLLRRPRKRAIDALRSLTPALSVPVQPCSTVFPSPTPPMLDSQALPPAPRHRAIDVLRHLPNNASTLLLPTATVSASSAPLAPDFKSVIPPSAPSIPLTQIQNPVRVRTHPRALDLLKSMSSPPKRQAPESIPSMSKPRPDASPSSRPSKKRRLQLPHEVIELIDSDSEETAEDIDVIEIFDSDQESDPPATRRAITTPDSVFNPNDLLQTRRTVRNWLSNEDFAAWVISREVFQSEQLDRDRKLPAANLRDLSSSYAISADDMESMHRYLMARYEADTFDSYIHLLALFKNTRAIEAVKARDRVFELTDISNSIEMARQSILRRLQLRRASS